MSECDFLELLKNINAKNTEHINSSNDPIEYVSFITDEFSEYNKIISSFFTGKENDIKYIYKVIKEKVFPYNKIHTIDINITMHSYSDYFKGLFEFMKKISSLTNSDEIDISKIQNTIQMVSSKDNTFIDSLFGGENNQYEDMDLNSAMKNIEVLIDINNVFINYTTIVNSFCSLIKGHNGVKYQNTMIIALKVFVSSIRHFIYKCIEEILKCYNDIQLSLKERVSVNGKKEIPKFQLF